MPLPRPRFRLRTQALSIGAIALLFACLKIFLYRATPVATIIGANFGFGTMPQNARGRHAFAIKNDGDAPLRLQLSEWTVPDPYVYTWVGRKKVFPKDGDVMVERKGEVSIFIEWETRQYNGEFCKRATFLTNDPGQPRVNLIVGGSIRPAGDEP
jgi:hypothetical protein